MFVTLKNVSLFTVHDSRFTIHHSQPFEMTDVHDKKTRSFNMSRIRSKDTKPELLVRKFLFAKGFRYKLHDKTLPGKPDLVFPKYKTVIFHGCFWHGHEGLSG
jgi:DNA mismatch endonuclease (patch repair protein)